MKRGSHPSTAISPSSHGVPHGVRMLTGFLGEYPVRPSVMEAFTQHNPRACLTPDDIEAIVTLYPDCSVTALSTPGCIVTYHNIGLVRIMIMGACTRHLIPSGRGLAMHAPAY